MTYCPSGLLETNTADQCYMIDDSLVRSLVIVCCSRILAFIHGVYTLARCLSYQWE